MQTAFVNFISIAFNLYCSLVTSQLPSNYFVSCAKVLLLSQNTVYRLSWYLLIFLFEYTWRPLGT